MPTFQIELDDGRKFEVDAVDQQSALQAFHPGVQQSEPLDKYHQKARDLITSQAAKGRDISGGYLDKYLKGATLGFGDEAVAGMRTALGAVVDPLKHIGDVNYKSVPLTERYNYEKALEDERAKDADRKTGAFGTAVELAAGLGTGVGAAKNGLTLIKEGQAIFPRLAAAAGEGAAYGGVAGAGEGDGVKDRLKKAAQGAALGSAFGGAAAGAGAALAPTAGAVASNLMARFGNPSTVAENLLGRTLARSGRSADEIVANLRAAREQGQGEYSLADELGPEGQRLTASITNAPGAQRAEITDFLHDRQTGAADRMASFLRDASGDRQTASQMEENLTNLRRREGNENYNAAKEDAGAVNVEPAFQAGASQLQDAANALNPSSTLDDTTIAGKITKAIRQFAGADGERLDEFGSVLAARKEIQSMIQKATPEERNALLPILKELDNSLASASPGYRRAVNNYASRSGQLRALEEGGATQSQNPQDVVSGFYARPGEQMQPYRTGYFENLIKKTLAGGEGNNVARPLRTAKARQEIQALAAPGEWARLVARTQREHSMAQMRNSATGGSSTARNLADMMDSGVDPTIFMRVMRGDFGGALQSAGSGVFNMMNGNTEAVRNELGGMLFPVLNNRHANVDQWLPELLRNVEGRARRNQKVRTNVLRGLLSMGGEQAGLNQ